MTIKKEAGKASGKKQTGNSNNGEDTKNKRTRIYPPERKYILVSKWNAPGNVLVLDRTKKGGINGNH